MPNHVTNRLWIIAPTKKREEEILTFLKGKENLEKDDEVEINEEVFIDFSAITPKPAWVFNGDVGPTERQIWGKNNWYDWQSENWGTKWNAYSQYYADDTVGSEEIPMIEFQTAWSAPMAVIQKLPFIFPDCAFMHIWSDEDYGNNVGYAIYEINRDNAILEFHDDSATGYSLAALLQYGDVTTEVIDEIMEDLDEDMSEEEIKDYLKRYDPLPAVLFISNKLEWLVKNKLTFLPEELWESYPDVKWEKRQ